MPSTFIASSAIGAVSLPRATGGFDSAASMAGPATSLGAETLGSGRGFMADFITEALVLSPTRPPKGIGTVTRGVVGGLTGNRVFKAFTDCGILDLGRGAIVREPAVVAGTTWAWRVGCGVKKADNDVCSIGRTLAEVPCIRGAVRRVSACGERGRLGVTKGRVETGEG